MIARNENPDPHMPPARPVAVPDAAPNDPHVIIDALRQRIAELEAQVDEAQESGAAAFNHMVHLGNLAAETIIANAYARAAQISGESVPAAGQTPHQGPHLVSDNEGPGADAEHNPATLNEEGANEFHEAWRREATFDERFADQSFFDIEYDDASRRWILDETA